MNITASTITKYELRELKEYHLDPITLILEDLGPRQGKLTISCYGEAWTAYWGGIGERPLIEFLLLCDIHYITDKLFVGDREEPDFRGFYDKEVRELLRLRRRHDITKQDAARLWDLLREQEHAEKWEDIDNEVASLLIGEDWHCAVDSVATSKYRYLQRIVTAAHAALKEIKEARGGNDGN